MRAKSISVFFILFLAMCFTGCKSAKTLVDTGALNKNLSTKQLVKEVNQGKSKFNTLASRVKIEIHETNKSKSYTVNLRLEKDKQILLSSTPISVVKALITPTRVAFYNKLDGTYFDGDFAYLSTLLGTALDFDKVQNMLLGEAILDVNAKDYRSDVVEPSYMLQPKNQLAIYELFFLFNPTHFKLDSQQIAQPEAMRLLQVDYLKYQKVQTQTLPEEMTILAVEKNEELRINLEYKSVEINEPLRFPFNIPSGYDEIKRD
ncbi:DUF4292 domain-containing protein [Lacinutrix neustonica]|uniref:DUF4292 domain-containing protein n=1 Tax=Lacinutrix neustonica TaxID=2980107 RepID=A0A9E8MUD5_9FLAO|nr:DUF4292 domain-containing protein [Lacinutrix neustonica]WAC01120.1 DUF4292 domain-containing protein [Lacinutrix neustonica]